MKETDRSLRVIGALTVALAVVVSLGPVATATAQAPGGRGGLNRAPDPRVQQRTYAFSATNEEMTFALFVSSKVAKDKKAPLIVALHGLGGDGNSLLRGASLELAEAGGYILVGPMGYNPSGWFGSPVIVMGGRGRGRGGPPGAAGTAGAPEVPVPAAPAGPPPERLAELSELDVRTVIKMIREEFTVDDDRAYLMGHSMGGAGALFLGQKYANEWAAVAAIAPAAFLMQPNSAQILQPMKKAGVPVMIVQGGADTVVPATNTRAWVESLKSLEMEHKYLEFPQGDHGNVITDGMPGIFDFFKANTR
jgi:poly(3-hydroxybutyrate) depolymerase